MAGLAITAWSVAPAQAASAASSAASRPAAPDAGSNTRDTAARARMLECGHQWNNMKRAGTASGTWKDFSRDCLAQR